MTCPPRWVLSRICAPATARPAFPSPQPLVLVHSDTGLRHSPQPQPGPWPGHASCSGGGVGPSSHVARRRHRLVVRQTLQSANVSTLNPLLSPHRTWSKIQPLAASPRPCSLAHCPRLPCPAVPGSPAPAVGLARPFPPCPCPVGSCSSGWCSNMTSSGKPSRRLSRASGGLPLLSVPPPACPSPDRRGHHPLEHEPGLHDAAVHTGNRKRRRRCRPRGLRSARRPRTCRLIRARALMAAMHTHAHAAHARPRTHAQLLRAPLRCHCGLPSPSNTCNRNEVSSRRPLPRKSVTRDAGLVPEPRPGPLRQWRGATCCFRNAMARASRG